MPESTEKVISQINSSTNDFQDTLFIYNNEYKVTDKPLPLFQRIEKK